MVFDEQSGQNKCVAYEMLNCSNLSEFIPKSLPFKSNPNWLTCVKAMKARNVLYIDASWFVETNVCYGASL